MKQIIKQDLGKANGRMYAKSPISTGHTQLLKTEYNSSMFSSGRNIIKTMQYG